MQFDAVELLRLQVGLQRLECFPWVHRVAACEEVGRSIPKLWPGVNAEVTLLDDDNRRHAMWREEMIVRRQNGCSRRQCSVAHGLFDLRSLVQCVKIGLEELGNDVSAKVDGWAVNCLLTLRFPLLLCLFYHRYI